MRQAAKGRPRAAEVVGPYGRTGRFPHLVGAGALTRPPQRIPPTRRGGYQPPVSNRVPFMVGPASVRPLRHARNGFVFCKGGLQTRLPFLEIRRGAQCAPAGRSGTGPYGVHRTGFCIFVGAAPCGRPQFYYIHTEKGGNKHSLKHKNTGGPAGPPVFYFSFCSFIIATFRTISSR